MEMYLNAMLVRLGLIVGGLVVLALLVFAVVLALKRKGRLDGQLDDARRYAEPVVRAGLRAAARRFGEGGEERRGTSQARRRRGPS